MTSATNNEQGRKSRGQLRASCWVDLNSQRFDAVAEASELPDHSRSAYSLQPFAHDLTAFFVADPSVQDYPEQGRKSRGLLRASCWVDLNSQRFDAVAEASELPRQCGLFRYFDKVLPCGLGCGQVVDFIR